MHRTYVMTTDQPWENEPLGQQITAWNKRKFYFLPLHSDASRRAWRDERKRRRTSKESDDGEFWRPNCTSCRGNSYIRAVRSRSHQRRFFDVLYRIHPGTFALMVRFMLLVFIATITNADRLLSIGKQYLKTFLRPSSMTFIGTLNHPCTSSGSK